MSDFSFSCELFRVNFEISSPKKGMGKVDLKFFNKWFTLRLTGTLYWHPGRGDQQLTYAFDQQLTYAFQLLRHNFLDYQLDQLGAKYSLLRSFTWPRSIEPQKACKAFSTIFM